MDTMKGLGRYASFVYFPPPNILILIYGRLTADDAGWGTRALTSLGPPKYKYAYSRELTSVPLRAINSVGECYLHTVEVTGSNPVSPKQSPTL